MNKTHQWVLATAAGIEGLGATELRLLGAQNVQAENGRVLFEGDDLCIAKTLVHVATADRLMIRLATFTAHSFEDLFVGVTALPWANILPQNAIFPVTARCVQSQLMSVPDTQAIAKKAVVESLKKRYRCTWFTEDGDLYPIHISIAKNLVSVYLDACDTGLHKRGYRTLTGEAPLRETLAAALVRLSGWQGQTSLYDPFCGTGTICVEAAMMLSGRAPGLSRDFPIQNWKMLFPNMKQTIEQVKEQAMQAQKQAPARPMIVGTDLSEQAIKMARYHAKQAGVAAWISFEEKDVRQFSPNHSCMVITNPPYGQRLGEVRQAEALYAQLGKALKNCPTYRLHALTAHPEFERHFGRRCNKKRKLYNGRLECNLYQYWD